MTAWIKTAEHARMMNVLEKRIAELKQAGHETLLREIEKDKRIAELEAENERLCLVRDAADCIKHWHDSGQEGMVVSAEHVRKLWSALDAAREGEK